LNKICSEKNRPQQFPLANERATKKILDYYNSHQRYPGEKLVAYYCQSVVPGRTRSEIATGTGKDLKTMDKKLILEHVEEKIDSLIKKHDKFSVDSPGGKAFKQECLKRYQNTGRIPKGSPLALLLMQCEKINAKTSSNE